MTLPPGQQRIDGFPRFGTHFHRPPPVVPVDPVIEIGGAVAEPVSLSVTELTKLPRTEITADFHCVAGWSATNVRWEGVAFETFYRTIVEPTVRPGAVITHLVFGGIDGFESLVSVEDALAKDVLIADRLDGRPLGSDHGAPARLVSPSQYGYISTKHLCRIELHTSKPTRILGAAHPISKLGLRGPLVMRHSRARVWEEERHPYLPARLVRPLYRLVIEPGMALAARHSEPTAGAPACGGSRRMKLPKAAHTSRPWRIHELTGDFRLEDVWALPEEGGPDDFPQVVQLLASFDPSKSSSVAVRTLFEIRWKLGALFGWDDPAVGSGTKAGSLRERLPADLREASSGPDFGAAPFDPLYLLDNEFAAEIANRTMHGVLHVGWVPDDTGRFHGRLAVLVKPNGVLGSLYMAAIRPFRYLIVYPTMLREHERTWREHRRPVL